MLTTRKTLGLCLILALSLLISWSCGASPPTPIKYNDINASFSQTISSGNATRILMPTILDVPRICPPGFMLYGRPQRCRKTA
ncbi:uncharacterized protein LOC115757966 [Drosophila novamexicana]|uniref:uncharacterized protein LOC115757966 n=1 Tax=Drosophila novamexicana TaxID=47314 RepID=UPI0011E5D313|nr:uncharacterized protein LOC115757966 [Drosophila novamexicana]